MEMEIGNGHIISYMYARVKPSHSGHLLKTTFSKIILVERPQLLQLDPKNS